MKYVLMIVMSVMLENGTYSDSVETFVSYDSPYDCKQGERAIKVVAGTLKQGGAKLKVQTTCRKRN